jgi:hypothetical protein
MSVSRGRPSAGSRRSLGYAPDVDVRTILKAAAAGKMFA